MSAARPAGVPLGGLHVLADDGPAWGRDPVAQARDACEGGASLVQLRAKHATDRQALAWGRAIREICRAAGVVFFVNDRFDLALACGADGVHLGQEDLHPDRLPPALRARLSVGRSSHTLEQAAAAAGEGADYVAFGPVFGTRSKHPVQPPRGLEQLAQAARAVAPRPLVAIGGIGIANAGPVVRAGAAGVAVISAVAGARDPRAAVAALAGAIRAAAGP